MCMACWGVATPVSVPVFECWTSVGVRNNMSILVTQHSNTTYQVKVLSGPDVIGTWSYVRKSTEAWDLTPIRALSVKLRLRRVVKSSSQTSSPELSEEPKSLDYRMRALQHAQSNSIPSKSYHQYCMYKTLRWRGEGELIDSELVQSLSSSASKIPMPIASPTK